ncbi:sigma-70 family RNA polymerase sigma factor [Baekduia soli]|uniref:sigma-70 family RNA polymerase sigma factor n=1 Tax=Baekduia soli TaxID=496014 RepID=UPI0016522CAE|nr:sigma-70 family RNA polymerase sigma factor [Baekduia soli]
MCWRRVRHSRPAGSPRSRPPPAGAGDADGGLEIVLGAEDSNFTVAEDRATIASLIRRLTPREREIVRLRFEEDLTQAEIGEIVGLSQMHVSRVLRTAVEKLRGVAEAGSVH